MSASCSRTVACCNYTYIHIYIYILYILYVLHCAQVAHSSLESVPTMKRDKEPVASVFCQRINTLTCHQNHQNVSLYHSQSSQCCLEFLFVRKIGLESRARHLLWCQLELLTELAAYIPKSAKRKPLPNCAPCAAASKNRTMHEIKQQSGRLEGN